MPTILEPGTRGRNVISGALALDLDQNVHLFQVFAIPFGKRGKQLQAVALRTDVHVQTRAIRWWRLVQLLPGLETSLWQCAT